MTDPRTDREYETNWSWVIAFAALAVVMRVLPRLVPISDEARLYWNLMPVGALGLFAGVRLRKAGAWLVPLATMLAADLLLIVPLAWVGKPAFNSVTPFVYGSFLLYVLIGRSLRPSAAPWWVGMAAVAGSVQFFLVTNYAFWATGTLYPRTLEGLWTCYAAALPFFKNTLAGDLVFTALFFGLHTAVVFMTQRQKVSQPA
jgi:hypothetical protein